MRNKYPGVCYRCGERVEAEAGHFERVVGATVGKWRTQHAECAIAYRGKNTPTGSVKRPRDISEARSIAGETP